MAVKGGTEQSSKEADEEMTEEEGLEHMEKHELNIQNGKKNDHVGNVLSNITDDPTIDQNARENEIVASNVIDSDDGNCSSSSNIEKTSSVNDLLNNTADVNVNQNTTDDQNTRHDEIVASKFVDSDDDNCSSSSNIKNTSSKKARDNEMVTGNVVDSEDDNCGSSINMEKASSKKARCDEIGASKFVDSVDNNCSSSSNMENASSKKAIVTGNVVDSETSSKNARDNEIVASDVVDSNNDDSCGSSSNVDKLPCKILPTINDKTPEVEESTLPSKESFTPSLRESIITKTLLDIAERSTSIIEKEAVSSTGATGIDIIDPSNAKKDEVHRGLIGVKVDKSVVRDENDNDAPLPTHSPPHCGTNLSSSKVLTMAQRVRASRMANMHANHIPVVKSNDSCSNSHDDSNDKSCHSPLPSSYLKDDSNAHSLNHFSPLSSTPTSAVKRRKSTHTACSKNGIDNSSLNDENDGNCAVNDTDNGEGQPLPQHLKSQRRSTNSISPKVVAGSSIKDVDVHNTMKGHDDTCGSVRSTPLKTQCNPSSDNVEELTSRSGRKRKISLNNSKSMHDPKSVSRSEQTNLLLELIQKVRRKCDKYGFFSNPVNPIKDECPDYYDIIPHNKAMDLETLESLIKDEKVITIDNVKELLENIVSCALAYNVDEDNFVRIQAKQFGTDVKPLIVSVRRKVDRCPILNTKQADDQDHILIKSHDKDIFGKKKILSSATKKVAPGTNDVHGLQRKRGSRNTNRCFTPKSPRTSSYEDSPESNVPEIMPSPLVLSTPSSTTSRKRRRAWLSPSSSPPSCLNGSYETYFKHAPCDPETRKNHTRSVTNAHSPEASRGSAREHMAGIKPEQPKHEYKKSSKTFPGPFIPKCRADMSTSIIVPCLKSSEWLKFCPEMVTVCNEAARRLTLVANPKAENYDKPLSDSYIEERMEFEEPIYGYIVRSIANRSRTAMQGFIVCTVFKVWRKSFRWDSTDPHAGISLTDRKNHACDDGSLARELSAVKSQTTYRGDVDRHGYVYPNVAEIALLGGLGCGAMLVKKVLNELRECGKFQYAVLQSTKMAVGFYEKQGFRQVGATCQFHDIDILPKVAYRHWSDLINGRAQETSYMMAMRLFDNSSPSRAINQSKDENIHTSGDIIQSLIDTRILIQDCIDCNTNYAGGSSAFRELLAVARHFALSAGDTKLLNSFDESLSIFKGNSSRPSKEVLGDTFDLPIGRKSHKVKSNKQISICNVPLSKKKKKQFLPLLRVMHPDSIEKGKELRVRRVLVESCHVSNTERVSTNFGRNSVSPGKLVTNLSFDDLRNGQSYNPEENVAISNGQIDSLNKEILISIVVNGKQPSQESLPSIVTTPIPSYAVADASEKAVRSLFSMAETYLKSIKKIDVDAQSILSLNDVIMLRVASIDGSPLWQEAHILRYCRKHEIPKGGDHSKQNSYIVLLPDGLRLEKVLDPCTLDRGIGREWSTMSDWTGFCALPVDILDSILFGADVHFPSKIGGRVEGVIVQRVGLSLHSVPKWRVKLARKHLKHGEPPFIDFSAAELRESVIISDKSVIRVFEKIVDSYCSSGFGSSDAVIAHDTINSSSKSVNDDDRRWALERMEQERLGMFTKRRGRPSQKKSTILKDFSSCMHKLRKQLNYGDESLHSKPKKSMSSPCCVLKPSTPKASTPRRKSDERIGSVKRGRGRANVKIRT